MSSSMAALLGLSFLGLVAFLFVWFGAPILASERRAAPKEQLELPELTSAVGDRRADKP